MTPAVPTNYNSRYGKPANWDEAKDGQCLEVFAYTDNGVISTLWTPDADELKALNEGGCVLLGVMCGFMPPVVVGVVTSSTNKEDEKSS